MTEQDEIPVDTDIEEMVIDDNKQEAKEKKGKQSPNTARRNNLKLGRQRKADLKKRKEELKKQTYDIVSDSDSDSSDSDSSSDEELITTTITRLLS